LKEAQKGIFLCFLTDVHTFIYVDVRQLRTFKEAQKGIFLCFLTDVDTYFT